MATYRVFFDRGGTSETFPEKAETSGTIKAGEIQVCHYVEVEASTAQLAATTVKEAFGQGVETLKTFVGTTGNVEEKTA